MDDVPTVNEARSFLAKEQGRMWLAHVSEVQMTNGLKVKFVPPVRHDELMTWSSFEELVYRAAIGLERKRMTVDHVVWRLNKQRDRYEAVAVPPPEYDQGLTVVVS